MRTYNADSYETVVICGSFRKLYGEIVEVIKLFEENGIKVLSPQIKKVINPEDDFIKFEGEENIAPNVIENAHLSALKEADMVYFYNKGGKFGFSSAIELGYCLANGIEFCCLEDLHEESFAEILKDKICTPNELIRNFKISDEVTKSRDWFDNFYHRIKECEL